MSEKGLYGKYKVVNQSTGQTVDNCFVLKPESDGVALAALRTYAAMTSGESLKRDLYKWINWIEDSKETGQ